MPLVGLTFEATSEGSVIANKPSRREPLARELEELAQSRARRLGLQPPPLAKLPSHPAAFGTGLVCMSAGHGTQPYSDCRLGA